ncbi:MAG: 4Fe-4S dicluster domain-containing protein [Thermoguttaceae bacterium]|jgi:heterodisulfide reductase subunit C
MTETLAWAATDELLHEVQDRAGTPVAACFQCHKCTTGCPMGPEMDFLPSQVMRLVHLGAEAELLGSQAIWQCASCEACTARCPMGIDIAAVMDALRIMAIDRKVALPDARGKQFNRSFLGSVRRHGRVFEMGMMAFYKLRTLDLFSDVGKVPAMLAKGKLALLPHRSGSAKQVREVFRRAQEEEEKRGQSPFVRSTLRAVPANGDCPLFSGQEEEKHQ